MEMSTTNFYIEPRRQMIKWVREQLVGPPTPKEDPEEPELHGVLPTDRFPCGALYPVSEWGEGIDPAEEEVDEVGADISTGEENSAEPAVVRRYMPPSSLGFSFFISGDNIQFQVLCSAACYYNIKSGERDELGRFISNKWKRISLTFNGKNEHVINAACPGKNESRRIDVFEGKARIELLWRQFANGWIVTTSMCNQNQIDNHPPKNYSHERAEKTLFEAQLRCVFETGEVGVYPRVDRSLLDEEAQEIELQYVNRHIYAVGHGCAVDWIVSGNKVTELRSNTLPTVEVPQVTADITSGNDNVLSLAYLEKFDNEHYQQLAELSRFVDGYKKWVTEQRASTDKLHAEDQNAGKRIVERMDMALSRMRMGLELLNKDVQTRTAFALANRAMLDQMRQSDQLRGNIRQETDYRWRPFQLAFLLTSLESSANENSEYRDTVDLIWFPTGGGKTEAYLGLTAFQIVLRRLRYPETGGGTTVLMRYTLRLLTRDQFIRATRMLSALELIRRNRSDLVAEPISIGLWVGDATSPNSFWNVKEKVANPRGSGAIPGLVIEHCPWCGDSFTPGRNYESTDRSFHFLCRNSSCAFGSSSTGRLPCNVVDEALYEDPPTMLVATVDKFARLAWVEGANVFFGGRNARPPELIIQDELHLIAGALGSVAGLYEAAIDTVLQLRGVYPKYIASTATIRMASQQVRRLYGREVAVFPPPGLSCDDSFFARTVSLDQRPGRIYVGYLAPLLNRQQCMAPLAATLLRAPLALFTGQQNEQDLLDAWWTQVVFHGSLKGVGNSATAFTSTVRDFMQLLKDPKLPDRSTTDIAQLTSLQTAEENAAIFNRLTLKRHQQGCLDGVLGTNMISVGLDVARLALMVVNGQPLTTAEYIQSSSRVGRSDVPGLVFANYYRDQARSLSHYESFRPYHEAFYRFVEPTSVTPYTYQSRLRALHAAIVIVIRHAGIGFLTNDSAGKFDPSNEHVTRAIMKLKQRCGESAKEIVETVNAHIDAIIAEWKHETERCRLCSRALDYQVRDADNGRDRLLFAHDDKIRGLWPTLHSMRNVEHTALLKVL